MKTHTKTKSILSVILIISMLIGTYPITAFAAQSNEYTDPADIWLSSNNRTNELDINSTTTYETQYCHVCGKATAVLTYRVPEYTRSGETALNRGVLFSDGTLIDGSGTGNLDSGTPGVNASYTGYHWTKTVCQNCGTMNTVNGPGYYSFNKNVYALNPCDNNFFMDFDSSTYVPYDEDHHTTTLKRGKYCKFCKGTYAKATVKLENHDFSETVDAQVGNNRFFISKTCDTCDYDTHEYVTAKAVVASYYGVEDGEAHTVTVSDLSDRGVRTSIRYGTSAESCTDTTAPSYVNPGYNAVYYQIDYSYAGKTMTENGVSYVWILEKDESENTRTIVVVPPAHEHEYHYVETVKPSCEELGYELFQCAGCGDLEKRNYTPPKGHNYEKVVLREATCKQGGLILTLCKDCGDFYQETTAVSEHSYHTHHHEPTCRLVGYDEHICEVCGHSYITDITPIISHSYIKVTKAPDCLNKGYSTYTCTMCGSSYVDDYVDALGHDWDEGHTVTSPSCTGEGVIEYRCRHDGCNEKMIKAIDAAGHTPGPEATCTEPQKCLVCNTVLALPKGHSYETVETKPTCTSSGFLTHTCSVCSDSYVSDYVDPLPHSYEETKIPATCTAMGYSIFRCKDCGDEYKSNYINVLDHDYIETITAPTCTSMGYSTFRCSHCDASYVSNYVDKTEHNYNKEVIPPTCTEHGHSIYVCPDCGASYIDEVVESTKHNYEETKIPATCTTLGYSIFKCNDCGDEYISNYIDKLPHDYEMTVIPPTCTGLGYTQYHCKNCDDNFKGDYTEPTGHTPSDWIIDIPATIENAGSKHIECLVCNTVLKSTEIPQLLDEDRSDEDGNATVGAYHIILTDSKNIPIFDSDIKIDVNDNITIALPAGRLLDYNDQITVNVFHSETQSAAAGLKIFIYDAENNAATGTTDANGQLLVPNNQSSTGDDNGTIGKTDGEERLTYVVRVSNKENIVIPDCDVYIGESNNIVVDLPEGIKPSSDVPVIVTVEDQHGNPQKNVTVIALGDNDYIEKGKTDVYGRVALPMVSEGFTNSHGHVTVDNIIVIVNDELGLIENAFIKHGEDGSISVTLPDGKYISYANRTTVTLLDSEGLAISDATIRITDSEERSYTSVTDQSGKIVVPPLSEDYSDEAGIAVVNGYTVLITDQAKPIENAFVEIVDEIISISLPDGVTIGYKNRITANITDTDSNPVNGFTVVFTDAENNSEAAISNESGNATVPPINRDITDNDGKAKVNGYNITLNDETKTISDAFVEITDGKISILLPSGITINYNNRITATVTDKNDKPVRDISITLTEAETESDTGANAIKSMTVLTDYKGKAVFPPLSEDITDTEGSSTVTDNKDESGKDTDGDGTLDIPAETIETRYIVSVSDTTGIIPNAFVKVEDSKITVTLPDDKTLSTANQTTVTVKGNDNNPIKDVPVTIKDKTTALTGTTDANGKVTLPVISYSGGGGGSRSSGGGGGGSYSAISIKVVDKDGKTVSVSKATSTEKATLTLPADKNLVNDDNYYEITVTTGSKANAGYTIVIKDRNGNEATGVTDSNGKLTLPGITHKSYIVGYPDGNFKPNGNITRGEAAAIFARLIADAKGETISGESSFKGIDQKKWYAPYVGYLEKYAVISGYSDNTFRADRQITRAEFVTMSVRYYDLFADLPNISKTNKYSDISPDYWAIEEISVGKELGWLNGYADGTFRGDNKITRAEAVTVINRAIACTPDKEYINKNYTKLNRFTDITDNSAWFFYDVLSAANTHKALNSADSEVWIK